MIGDRSKLLKIAIWLGSSAIVGYYLFIYRNGRSLVPARAERSPALEHFTRFRDESLRLIYSKLDDARQNCLRIRSSLLAPSGSPRSISDGSLLSGTADVVESVSSIDSLGPTARWETARESGQVEENLTDIHRDCFLSVPDMIRENGFPCEEITVETEDGFLLGLQRMPNENGPAVLLQHGLLADASNWVTGGPDHGLAYQLWDRGFDVFLGNSRGNPYSRRHKSLSPKKSDFWHWTFEVPDHCRPFL